MSINIYRHEFNARLKSVVIWSLGIAFLIVFFTSLFPVFSEQAAAMKEFMSRYPAQLRAAFGLDKVDLSTILGFLSFTMMFVELCLAIQASNYGFGLVSIEETELTADFLLTKPVSRLRVLTSKLLAVLCSLLVTEAVVWACTFASVLLFRAGHEYSVRTLVLLLVSLLILQLVFLGVGLFISLLARRIRSVTPLGLGLAFGAYVINGFSGILGDIKLELLTPFKHLESAYIVKNSAYNTPLVLLDLAVILVTIGLSYWLYVRRDIPAVS